MKVITNEEIRIRSVVNPKAVLFWDLIQNFFTDQSW